MSNGDEKAVTTLLAQDPSLLDETNANTILNNAVDRGHVGMVALLIAQDPRDEAANYNALRWAARQGHRNLVAQILANWPDLISRKPMPRLVGCSSKQPSRDSHSAARHVPCGAVAGSESRS